MKARLHRYAHLHPIQGSGSAKHCGQGFTFIELLVTVAISMLLFTGAVAGYNRFNDVSRLEQAALTLKNNLRLAQNKAVSGEKPLNLSCDQLTGYIVTFTATTYAIQAECNPPQADAPITQIPLANTVTFSPVPSPMTFEVLTRGVNISADRTVTLTSGSRTYQLKVSPQGEITDGGLQ